MRYWASWEQKSDDPRPINYPPNKAILGWWCSGEGFDYFTNCAVIEVDHRLDAAAAVSKDWPEFNNTGWRFLEEKPNDWMPGARFPLEDWMFERFGITPPAKGK